MFYLLLLALLIYFVVAYWPVAVALFILFIAILIYAGIRKKPSYGESDYGEPYDKNSSPKIGASVSQSFYDEAWAYCHRHHMTMSDLIRNSVKKYMDENH